MVKLNNNFHNKKCTAKCPPNHALLSNFSPLAEECTPSHNQNVYTLQYGDAEIAQYSFLVFIASRKT